MWGLLKSLFYLVVIMLLLTIIGPILLIVFGGKNIDYKPQLIEMLQNMTGRDVKIGAIQWTGTPSVGFRVEDVQMSNPAGFGNAEFLTAKSGRIDVDLSSLLKGRLQMGNLTLDGVTVNLIKNSEGKTNWDFKSPASTTPANSSATPKTAGGYAKYAVVAISKIDLKNANIIFDDQQIKKQYAIHNLTLSSENIAYNQAFPIIASFVFNAPQVSEPIEVKLTANIIGNVNKIRLDNIDAQTNQYRWQGWVEESLGKKDLSAINGFINVSGSNGAFKGIDVFYYTDLAESFVNKTEPTRQDTRQTPFKTLSASLDIKNGVVNNNDLILNATGITITGKGNINLITQQLNYRMALQRLTSGAEIKPRGPAIPLLITGDLEKPKIRPDLQTFIVQNYGKQIQDKISEGLQALLS